MLSIIDEVNKHSQDKLDEQTTLRFVQMRRLKYVMNVEEETEGNIASLSAGKQLNYLSALSAIESQVITLKKMANEAEGDAADRALAAQIVKTMSDIQSQMTKRNLENHEATLDERLRELPAFTPIAGQTMIGDSSENYQEFTERFVAEQQSE